MPHLHLSHVSLPALPERVNDYTFEAIYESIDFANEWLIEVTTAQKKFLLLLKKSEDTYLLKAEKSTRPSPNFYIQQALRYCAQLMEATILNSNLPLHIKTHHLQEEQTTLKSVDYFAQHFPDAKEIAIEVGFGSGRHLLYQARQNPHRLHIGLEIHKPSIEQVVKQLYLQNLTNVLVLDYDARLFLELVPSNRLTHLFVHFPVPWDKKPSRRVISSAFVDEAMRALGVDGVLHLRTDSELYFNFALETFLSYTQQDIRIQKNIDAPISSKYEDRWRKMEKNIYDVFMRNLIDSPAATSQANFNFSAPIAAEAIAQLPMQNILDSLGFVHLERRYRAIKGDAALIRVSMGSFERPQQLYLKSTTQSMEYFPHAPIATRTNLHLHTLLEGVLHG
ncbi:MAG: hypothetical protein KU37_10345 [Sulfuricurvum sp. PC08-66]|nr:MAG: hypothetical protein KU37_10345 [Sulfuricurvum sp. PC08-66]